MTRAGVVFARYARQILGLLDEATAAAAGELQPEQGKLALGDKEGLSTAEQEYNPTPIINESLPPYRTRLKMSCPLNESVPKRCCSDGPVPAEAGSYWSGAWMKCGNSKCQMGAP